MSVINNNAHSLHVSVKKYIIMRLLGMFFFILNLEGSFPFDGL